MKKIFIIIPILTVIISIIFTLTIFNQSTFFSKYPTLGAEIWQNGLLSSPESFEYSPLYSIICALLYPLLGSRLLYYALLMSIIGGLNVYILILITKKLFDDRTALISSILYIISAPFIIYNTDLLAAPLVVLFNALSILYFLYWTDDPSKKNIIYSGLFLGLSVIIRPNILVFVCFISLYLLIKRNIKPLLYFIIPIFLCILPITTVNFIRTGELVLVEDSGPPILYSSNNYNSIGLGYAPPGVLQVLEARFERGQEFTAETSRLFKDIAIALHDRDMTVSEINSFYLQETKKQILGDPKRYIRLSLQRLWYSFHFFADYDVISTLLRGEKIRNYFLPSGILLILGLTGLFLYKEKHIKYPIIIIYILSYLVFFFLFYVTERFRLPLIYIIIPFSSHALLSIYEMLRKKEIEKTIIIIVSIFALFIAFGFENNTITYRKEHTKPKFLYQFHIITAYYQNDYAFLIDTARKILRLDPMYDSVWFYLNRLRNDPELPAEYIPKINNIYKDFRVSYEQIIEKYRQKLSVDLYDLEALKFVSSFNVQLSADTDDFRIIPDMIDQMKMISPADPEIYFIESAFYNKLADNNNAIQAIDRAIEYGILYSFHYRDSARLAVHIYLNAEEEQKAITALNLLKNLFPDDIEFRRIIEYSELDLY